MFDSVLPAESEPISVVSSGWLWAARCFALMYTISLLGEYVAAAHFDPLNSFVGFLVTFGLRILLSVVLLYFLFHSGKKSLAFALGLGAATGFIALFGVASSALFWPLGRSFNLALAIIIFGSIYSAVCRYDASTQPTACHGGVGPLLVLRYLFGGARVKQRRHIQENGARSKGDRGLRFAFRAGICCPLVAWLIFMLLIFIWLAAVGGIHI